MQDEQDLSQEKQPFVPAVDPEKLSEGRIFWVETEDGSKLNIGNVVKLKLQEGSTWAIEAVTANSESVVIGRYADQATAELAMRYITTDSERQANGQPVNTTHGLPKTHGGHYTEANVLDRHHIETTPLDGE